MNELEKDLEDYTSIDTLKIFLDRQNKPLGDLTERQMQVVTAIFTYSKKFGIPPAIRDLQKALGIKTTNGIREHLKVLVKKGWLRNRPGRQARACILSENALSALNQSPRSGSANILRSLNDFVLDFPDNLQDCLDHCKTPQEGALLVVNIMEEILAPHPSKTQKIPRS